MRKVTKPTEVLANRQSVKNVKSPTNKPLGTLGPDATPKELMTQSQFVGVAADTPSNSLRFGAPQMTSPQGKSSGFVEKFGIKQAPAKPQSNPLRGSGARPAVAPPNFNPEFIGQLQSMNGSAQFDRIPGLGEMPEYPHLDDLKDQIEQVNEALERETENGKLLTKKCEEYLNQIQRSADILQNVKEKHDIQVATLNDRLDEVESMLKQEQERVDLKLLRDWILREKIRDCCLKIMLLKRLQLGAPLN